jgi:ABC-type transport system involved in multi-copper enzyme maturation permease subunit
MLAEALIITRREIRDSLRDWRIIAPILILTLIFPYIMNLSTQVAINFVQEYNATIIPLHLIPFALMIVGFFPISFSLVIALETFVGEKERNSLEPLLASPLSDASLYFGKLFSAMLPPLLASYLGIVSYLSGLFLSLHYTADPTVLLQILLLTSMEALVMVAGAVVVSSHTTSVRAANLLASFIIIPMAFLLQGESVLLFWGQYEVLWYIIAALVVVDLILIRMGVQTFNREEILAREIDEINLRKMLRQFAQRLVGPGPFSLGNVYGRDLPRLLVANRLPLGLTVLLVIAAVGFGAYFGNQFKIPQAFKVPLHVTPGFEQSLQNGNAFLPGIDTGSIFFHNTRTLLLSAALSIFSFGAGALLVLLPAPLVVGFFASAVTQVGANPFVFLLAFILPHGIFELPAVILATAFALRVGA